MTSNMTPEVNANSGKMRRVGDGAELDPAEELETFLRRYESPYRRRRVERFTQKLLKKKQSADH